MKIRGVYVVWAILLLLLIGVSYIVLLTPTENQAAVEVVNCSRVNNDALALVHRNDSTEEQKFTIIMQTYKRTDILLKLLKHYQAVPDLQQIIIVWNNIGEQTPEKLWNSYGPHPVPVVFKEQTINRVRNRFQQFPEIDTDAVLMLDDDMQVSVPDTSLAFTVWKQFPDQLVGFVPRKHVLSDGIYHYGSFELKDPETGSGDKYSMVLTSAVFFHRRYLELYQNQPEEIHVLVDETQNCDDIVFNFVVALYLRKLSNRISPMPSAIFVKPSDLRNFEKDSSEFKGLWHRPGHFQVRSDCLNRLTKIYGFMPLCYSNLMVSHLTHK